MFSCGAAFADAKQDSQSLANILITETLFESGMKAQRPLIIGALRSQFSDKGIQVSDIDVFVDVLIEEMLVGYTAKMQAAMAKQYETDFTAAELAELLTFYRSETGQKLVDLSPEYVELGTKLGAKIGGEEALFARERVIKRLKDRDVTISTSDGVFDRLLKALQ